VSSLPAIDAGGPILCHHTSRTMVPSAGKRHQFRLMLCGHKAVEAGAVCVALMLQGHLLDVTAAHLLVASKTGLLAVMPVLAMSFTRHARALLNRWTGSAILALTTFGADAIVHTSHYPGAYTEAALTGVGAGVLSLFISYTRLGHYIDGLGESFLRPLPSLTLTIEGEREIP
jgi:hypothetical protein